VLVRDVTAYWMPRLKRGMTVREYGSAFSRRDASEFCTNIVPQKSEGVGNAGCPMHPQPRVRILVVSMHTSIHSEPPESPGIPARNGFNGFLRALPGDRLSCHRRQRNEFRQLDASIEASGPHDFAVRFRAIRQRHCHVHRIPPRVRDDRERPSIGTGWRINKTVSTERRNEIFLQRGLDTKSLS